MRVITLNRVPNNMPCFKEKTPNRNKVAYLASAQSDFITFGNAIPSEFKDLMAFKDGLENIFPNLYRLKEGNSIPSDLYEKIKILYRSSISSSAYKISENTFPFSKGKVTHVSIGIYDSGQSNRFGIEFSNWTKDGSLDDGLQSYIRFTPIGRQDDICHFRIEKSTGTGSGGWQIKYLEIKNGKIIKKALTY